MPFYYKIRAERLESCEASLIEQYDEAISWRKNGSAKRKAVNDKWCRTVIGSELFVIHLIRISQAKRAQNI